MNPLTGQPDAADMLHNLRRWLREEVDLQQAVTDRARINAIAAMVAATYPGLVPNTNQPEPTLPYWLVRGRASSGPITRATLAPNAGADGALFVRIELQITNSPLALNFTVDPAIAEADFRTLVRSQYAVIAQAA